jgi:phospholipid/cholesterol/gamma-HCH transport system ATP-binding protein
MEKSFIEFQNVTKCFGNRTVLDNVNLKINEGDITTIIGKSGTGKSVLLKHIIGLLSPTEGQILFRGKPVNEMSTRDWLTYKSQFSYLFQNNALFDSMTVYENIALPLQQTTNLSKKIISEKVMTRIEQLDLSETAHKYPAALSGGMQKRVALARALVTDPKIVLFDEPTTGQDPIRKHAILSMIVQNQKRFGFTTVMISHDIPDVFFISDRILILYDGKIIFQDSYDALDQFEHPIVDEFIKSLEGFQDELTGLHSHKNFYEIYGKELSKLSAKGGFAVIIFIVEDLEGVSENVGHTEASVIVQSLGAYVNKHFGDIGISTRIGRDKIATILSGIDSRQAGTLLEEFARDLQDGGLADIQTDAQMRALSDDCFSFSIVAGLVDGKVGEDIEMIAKRAASKQKIIATFTCEMGR